MSDIWPALRPQLEHLSSPLPVAALMQAEAHRDTVAPHLLAELTALAADPRPAQQDGYVLHLYAMLLLAQWRDTRAYRPLAELGHLDEATVDTVFGQLVHDSYRRALASCCDGDIAPLTQLADDDGASFWPVPRPSKPSPWPRSKAAPPARRQSPSWPTSAPAKPSSCATSPTPAPISNCSTSWSSASPTWRHRTPAGHPGMVRRRPGGRSYAGPADIEADIRRSPAECCAAMRDAGRGLIDDIAHEAALWPAFHHQPPLELPPIPLGANRNHQARSRQGRPQRPLPPAAAGASTKVPRRRAERRHSVAIRPTAASAMMAPSPAPEASHDRHPPDAPASDTPSGFDLDDFEVRVLAVLIEKSFVTPDTLPLSVNALVTGCRQLTGREPVMSLSDPRAGHPHRLAERGLVSQRHQAGARVSKWEHQIACAIPSPRRCRRC
jgi:hypothetical protein